MSLLYKNNKFVKELSPNDFTVSNLNRNIHPKTKQPILIKYYAHWCPHCHSQDMMQFIEALAQVLPEKAGIIVGAFNCDYNNNHRDIAESAGIMGFPTIRYYNKNGEEMEYNGQREVEPMLKFLVANS